MRICVGSINPVKVDAVIEVIQLYPILKQSDVVSLRANSGVSNQPKTIEETVIGAKNRSVEAHSGHYDLGFGIGSGLIVVPGTKTGMITCCVCSIFDGKNFAIGISSGFECPSRVIEFVQKDGLDLNQAFKKFNLTRDPNIGSSEGAVGLLSKGRVSRKDYTKQAIIMAMIQLDNPEYYK